jgi:hypothetical protein
VARYGCFLPNLTGLARGLSATGLPQHYIGCRRRRHKLGAECSALQTRKIDFNDCRSVDRSIVVLRGGGDFAGRPLSATVERRRAMPDFILLLRRQPGPPPAVSAEEAAAMTSDYTGWRAEGRRKGGEKLTGDAGRVLSAANGRVTVTDGPYAESKELLGGFYVIAARDYDEACRIAESCPHLKYGGYIEIRQIDSV